MTGIAHYKRTERFMLLYSLYRRGNASMDSSFNLRDLGKEEGLSYKIFKSAYDYLCGERLIRPRTHSDNQEHFFYVSITDRGIDAIEEVFKNESKDSHYFPAYRDMMH